MRDAIRNVVVTLTRSNSHIFEKKILKMSLTLAGIYLLKVNNKNTRTRCEICSKLAIKIPERRYWRRSGIFIVNFEHSSHLVPVFLLLTLNMKLPAQMSLN